MKTIIRIEVIILVLLVLAAATMLLLSNGVWMLLEEPVVMERQAPPIPTDAAVVAEAIPVPEETKASDQPVPPEVSAKKYFVYDVREDTYLLTKGDLQEKLYPASITKLLSVYVILQYMDPEDTVVVGDGLTLVEPDSSLANLKEGDILTVGQLIEAMMLPSGNDAAHTAAVAAGRIIGGDSSLSPEAASEIFVAEMNKQAAALGMTGSHFVTADGFHRDDHYTTMKDLTILSAKVLSDPTIVGYTSKISDQVALEGHTETWKNTNYLLNPEYKLHIPSTIGLKTGYTSNAGSCLISAFFQGDRLLLIGVFGCPAFTEDRYQDTAALFDAVN